MRASCRKKRHCVEMAYGSEPVVCEGGVGLHLRVMSYNSTHNTRVCVCAAFLVSLETCSCVEI